EGFCGTVLVCRSIGKRRGRLLRVAAEVFEPRELRESLNVGEQAVIPSGRKMCAAGGNILFISGRKPLRGIRLRKSDLVRQMNCFERIRSFPFVIADPTAVCCQAEPNYRQYKKVRSCACDLSAVLEIELIQREVF